MAQLKDTVVMGNMRVTDVSFANWHTATGAALDSGMTSAMLQNNGVYFAGGSSDWRAELGWLNSRSLEVTSLGVVGNNANWNYMWLGGNYNSPTMKLTTTDATVYGNMTLSTSDTGNSPSLEFRRGSNADNYTDWKVLVSAGDLCFKKINQSTESTNFIMSEKNGVFGISSELYNNSTGATTVSDLTVWSYAKYLKVFVKDGSTSTYSIHDVAIETTSTCAIAQHATYGSSGLGVRLTPIEFQMSTSSGKWTITMKTGPCIAVNASQTPYSATSNLKIVKIIQCC